MKIYTSKEIQALAKIGKMQVLHWVQTGAVVPFEDARGRGGRRKFSQQNLIEFMICRELNRFSIETRVMKSVLDHLRKEEYVSFWKEVRTNPDHIEVSLLVVSIFVPKPAYSPPTHWYQISVIGKKEWDSFMRSFARLTSSIFINLKLLVKEALNP